jgi:hypothetical protein
MAVNWKKAEEYIKAGKGKKKKQNMLIILGMMKRILELLK